MRVLVATKDTQGRRKNDFCWAQEGEVVGFSGFECDGESVDGSCGCKRSMSGKFTLKATTTVKVVERTMTIEDLERTFIAALNKGQWIDPKLKSPMDAEFIAGAKSDAAEIVRIAACFEVGAVLEKRGSKFAERRRLAS